MRIAEVATVATPVRSDRCGSVESTVWLLTRELVRLGHQVTVFAAAGSDPAGELVATLPGPYATNGAPADWQLCEWINLCAAVERSEDFDVIHSHAYLWGIPLARLARSKMVHTTHVFPDADTARLWQRSPDECVTAISGRQWAEFPDLRPAAVIPHGVDPARHRFNARPSDYLCYFGRFTPGKGPLDAIEVARSLDMRLVLAGPVNDYYREQVAQHVDGRRIEYAGYLQPDERDTVVGGARALVYPLQVPEPFGLVLVEAMMSGTPAAGYGIGAVTDVVDDGVSGAWVPPGGDLASAVQRCLNLDRSGVRERARQRFTAERMADDYAGLYQRLVEAPA